MPRKCIEPDCAKCPVYNYPDETSKIYCRAHAKEGMIPVGQARCIEAGCTKYALYNFHGETKKLYCKTHCKPGMVNVKRKPCIFENCSTQPYYNYPGKTPGIYCNLHALKDMINVVTKTCQECGKIPSFGFPDDKYATYCKEHKKETMISLRGEKCQFEGCTAQASFAKEGCNKPIYCGKHKEKDMYNTRKKYCSFSGCTKTALFEKDDRDGKYCAEHKENLLKTVTDKLEDIKPINRPICQYKDCKVSASFGIDKPTHCVTHKTANMVSMFGCCKVSNCSIYASFNYPGEKPLYCGRHKKTDMINVVASRCIEKDCQTCATFGYPGFKPQFCATHKKSGTKLQPNKRCIVNKCNELALYGQKSATHCDQHSKPDDFNFIEKECKECRLTQILDINSLCRYCNPKTRKKFHLAKQKEIEALFKAEKLEYKTTDKTINGGECGKERPDFLFEGEAHSVIVEVDEGQHKSNACECEQTRMVNISQSLGEPCIFLRYNPDKYWLNGKFIDTPKGKRHSVLTEWLIKLMLLDPEELTEKGFLSVIHLYFDGYDPRNVEWTTITPFDKEN